VFLIVLEDEKDRVHNSCTALPFQKIGHNLSSDINYSIDSHIKRIDLKKIRNRYEAFISRFTHDSTAIEGNTLTLQ